MKKERKQSLLTQLEGSKQTRGWPKNVGVRFLAGLKKKGKIFTGIVCAIKCSGTMQTVRKVPTLTTGLPEDGAQHFTHSKAGTTAS